MQWQSVLLAAIFGTPAAVMFIRGKGPRYAAILAALAVLCLLAGIPSLLKTIGHPLTPGPVLLGIVIAAIVFAMFFYLDIIRGGHKKPLFSRSGGGAGGAGAGGHNQHVRPLVASVGLAVMGLMVAMNWSVVVSGTGHGFTQTVNTITHAKPGA